MTQLLTALFVLAAQRPTLDSALLAAYKWRNIGPDGGRRSIAVSGVRGRPREGYFGATGGGLWKTTDGGNSWFPVTDGQINSASVGAVAVSESNPDIVYIGMGETCLRGNIMPGDGVYRSTDAGKTWTHVGFAESHGIAKIRIHPTNPQIVFVASFGKYSAPSPERGIFKSSDGGRTWRKVLYRDDKTGGTGHRRREILRAREEFCRVFFDPETPLGAAAGLSGYFLRFAVLARRSRSTARSDATLI